ncbi:NACHT, LRR and PYD domains-containing protein 1b allele 2-like [Varanus komodoensis]|uniref:NACHT, LRR and PYD domains-containing protein 1b allele 2-like n=1 Tax=Varanus komodoensis TaxID=61221 RepID=UPI001CF76847|nr:NACHT, LRR and PYD domains-containing protein 1b allele 2-like [Varanus komodoensis]
MELLGAQKEEGQMAQKKAKTTVDSSSLFDNSDTDKTEEKLRKMCAGLQSIDNENPVRKLPRKDHISLSSCSCLAVRKNVPSSLEEVSQITAKLRIIDENPYEETTRKPALRSRGATAPAVEQGAEKEMSGHSEGPEACWDPVICKLCPLKFFPVCIRPEIISDHQSSCKIYRFHSTGLYFFQCHYTNLIFEMRAAGTLTYHFDSWAKHLDGQNAGQLLVAGPLLNIHTDPEEAVTAVHFPHFLCLAGKSSSRVHIAHFTKEGMCLEKPDKVNPFHAMWRNPRFSPCGVVCRKPWFKRKIKVHAVALLFQKLHVPSMTLHLYLLPNDPSLKQAVQDHEATFPSQRVMKPAGTFEPLTLGSYFFVENLDNIAVCPTELPLRYLHAEMEQQYLELYAEHMQNVLNLILTEKKKKKKVWMTHVRPEDLNSTSLHPEQGARSSVQMGEPSTAALPGRSRMHFIDRHREQLILKTTNVEAVLDMLYGFILDDEQYQKISSSGTNPEKMRELYKLVPSWNDSCKDQLYKALKAKNRFLIDDLEGR